MNQSPRIFDIIEARMSSTRLPGKVMQECVGKPMLQHQIERLARAKRLTGTIVATTINPADDVIESLAAHLGVPCYRGSEDDVLSRVLEAAQEYDADVIVETPGDCPLIDWRILDEVIDTYLESGADYVSNNLKLTYPGGMDVQVFSTTTLLDVARRTSDPTDREHVSLFIYRNQDLYRCINVEAPAALADPSIKFLLDTPNDLVLIREVFESLYHENADFSCAEILSLAEQRPDLRDINRTVERTVV